MKKISKKLIKKIEKHKDFPIIVALSVSLCLESLALGSIIKNISDSKNAHKETISNIEFSVNYETEEVYKILSLAVNNNSNLSNREKEIILDNIWVFADNKDYLDIGYIENCLLTLKITYTTRSKIQNNVYVEASYSDNKNEITFYNASGIEDVDNDTFTHELFHVMQKVYYANYNDYLIETTNTIYNEEYTSQEETSLYTNYYYFLKMLIEIIGEEPVRRYQGYTDISPLMYSLVEIIDDEKYAKDFLANLDNYKTLYEKIKNNDSNSDNVRKRNLERLRSLIIDSLSNYYEAKYGFPMENDLIMLYYYDFDRFTEEFKRNICNYENVIIYRIDNNIKYFNQDMDNKITVFIKRPVRIKSIKLDINGNTVECSESVEEYCFVYKIDNENRYINNDLSMKKTISNN